jgi:hypothetical protein
MNVITLLICIQFEPFYWAILIDSVFLMILYIYLKLYSISIDGDYFIFENLFRKVKINKDQCIGISGHFPLSYTMIIKFKDKRIFRFQLPTINSFKSIFSLSDKTPEDEIFDKIQAFIDSPSDDRKNVDLI